MFFPGLFVGPLEGFADVWGASFLKNVHGFDSVTSYYLPSIIFIGMCFESPLLSFMAEKTGHYLGSIIGAGFFMGLFFLILLSKILTTLIIMVGISFRANMLCLPNFGDL